MQKKKLFSGILLGLRLFLLEVRDVFIFGLVSLLKVGALFSLASKSLKKTKNTLNEKMNLMKLMCLFNPKKKRGVLRKTYKKKLTSSQFRNILVMKTKMNFSFFLLIFHHIPMMMNELYSSKKFRGFLKGTRQRNMKKKVLIALFCVW